ncbi:MAG TPA: GNAT family N-acetyltransferase [Chloroflexia bacterium]|nr:GNAT family N-acetyltransferase [Chloroflexia bacterium]
MHEIETARLRLRLFRPDDLDALAPIYADPDVMRYMRSGQPATREQTMRTLDRLIGMWDAQGKGLWAVEHKADRVLIGQCGLFHLDNTPEVEVAYLLAQPYWGAGLASEAARACLRYGFEEWGLPRIVAVARPENRASQQVMRKIGMLYEKHARYYDLDVVYYAIDRAAFQPDAAPYQIQLRGQ